MPLVLGIDLGTSYFKVALFDANGALKGLGRVSVEKTSPAPGRFELPIDVFWRLLRQGLSDALSSAAAVPAQIAAISYSSQANTFVLMDCNSQPLTPLILWTDNRGEPVETATLDFARSDRFRAEVGFIGLNGQFAVTKWQWYKRNDPDLWAQVDRVMTISDYLTFSLTGVRAGDASTAAFLGLYDLKRRGWSESALRTFAVDPRKLSTPLRPGTRCGRTGCGAETLLGVPAGIPFAVGALDHHAAAIGAGLERFGGLSISTGTVLAALALVDTVAPAVGCFHGPHVDDARYYRLAFSPYGAGQLEEYRERAAPDLGIDDLLQLAAGSSAPRSAPSADHSAAVWVILQRIASDHRELVRQVSSGSDTAKIIATGGGARSTLWLQIYADIFGMPIVTSACPEPACLGAALFAAVASERHPTLAAASDAMVRVGPIFEPRR